MTEIVLFLGEQIRIYASFATQLSTTYYQILALDDTTQEVQTPPLSRCLSRSNSYSHSLSHTRTRTLSLTHTCIHFLRLHLNAVNSQSVFPRKFNPLSLFIRQSLQVESSCSLLLSYFFPSLLPLSLFSSLFLLLSFFLSVLFLSSCSFPFSLSLPSLVLQVPIVLVLNFCVVVT